MRSTRLLISIPVKSLAVLDARGRGMKVHCVSGREPTRPVEHGCKRRKSVGVILPRKNGDIVLTALRWRQGHRVSEDFPKRAQVAMEVRFIRHQIGHQYAVIAQPSTTGFVERPARSEEHTSELQS